MKRLIAELDDLQLKFYVDAGPSRDLPEGGARITQVLHTEGLKARGQTDLELVGVQAAATQPALELLASVARFVADGASISLGETLNLGISTVALSKGEEERLRLVDHDWPNSGRPVAESAVRLLSLVCEDVGFSALREGAPADARGFFEAAAELEPTSVTARMGEAFGWRDEGRFDRAEQLFSAALVVAERTNLDSTRKSLIHFERARVAREQGGGDHLARALKDFAQARAIDSDNLEFAYEHAHALFLAGDGDAARAALGEVHTKMATLDRAELEAGAKMPSRPPELRTIPGYSESGGAN